MSYDRFCHTAEQEPSHALMSSGTKHNDVSMPTGGGIDDRLADIPMFDDRIYPKPCRTELLRIFVD